jgi:hypothetical protein
MDLLVACGQAKSGSKKKTDNPEMIFRMRSSLAVAAGIDCRHVNKAISTLLLSGGRGDPVFHSVRSGSDCVRATSFK